MPITKTPMNKSGSSQKPPMSRPNMGAAGSQGAKNAAQMMDDVAIVSDMLATQKTLIKSYGTALCEGSNEKFRGLCNAHLTELAEDQYDSFLYMHERNLYPTDPATAPKLSEAKQKFKAAEMKIKK